MTPVPRRFFFYLFFIRANDADHTFYYYSVHYVFRKFCGKMRKFSFSIFLLLMFWRQCCSTVFFILFFFQFFSWSVRPTTTNMSTWSLAAMGVISNHISSYFISDFSTQFPFYIFFHFLLWFLSKNKIQRARLKLQPFACRSLLLLLLTCVVVYGWLAWRLVVCASALVYRFMWAICSSNEFCRDINANCIRK